MRKLFLAITIPILVVLGTPALAATLMYDGTGDENMPTYLYTDDYDGQQMLFTELNNSINEVENGDANDLTFHLHSDIINRMIYEAIVEQNPDYAPGDDCTTDNECYIFSEPLEVNGYNFSFRVVGMWVSFYDGATASDPGSFTFNIFLEIHLSNGSTYKTVVELHFTFEDNDNYYYLEFNKVQIGRLPLPKSIFTSVIGIIENQANIDLQSQLSNLPIGELDLTNLSYKIQKDDILSKLGETQNGEVDSGALLSQELLSVIFDNQLVQLDLQDDEFNIKVGISQFSSDESNDIPAYLYNLHDHSIVNGETVIGAFDPMAFNPDDYINNLFTEFVINNALLGGGFNISEEDFNKIIYAKADGFSDMRKTVDIPVSDTETKSVEVGLKSIWFEFEDGSIYAKALFKFDTIESLLVMKADETSSTTDELKFEFVSITAGKDDAEQPGEYIEIDDMTNFQKMFAQIGDVEFGEFDENGDLYITTEKLTQLMQDGSNQGAVVVSAIELHEGYITIFVEPADPNFNAALNNFQDAISGALADAQILDDLGTVLDPNDGGTEQAVYESVQEIQAALSDPIQEVQPEQIEELFNNFEDLDPETQTEFLNTIVDSVDASVLDGFEDIFGLFADNGE
jgi:hypothetical protein